VHLQAALGERQGDPAGADAQFEHGALVCELREPSDHVRCVYVCIQSS
jgi:hypothetical protein